MADRVLRLKPARHGAHLNGKHVFIYNKYGGDSDHGRYVQKGNGMFLLDSYSPGRMFFCADWTVEEMVETVEL